MSRRVKCPRCGHYDTFIKGYLPDTCVCGVCQSQLDWKEIPGMGPDCRPLEREDAEPDKGEGGAGGVGGRSDET